MDLLADYDDHGEPAPVPAPKLIPTAAVTSAPGGSVNPSNYGSNGSDTSSALIVLPTMSSGSGALSIYNAGNTRADIMWAPSYGPSNTGGPKVIPDPSEGTIAGTTSRETVDATIFESQYRQFSHQGFAADPRGTGAFVGDIQKYMEVAGKKRGAGVLAGSLPGEEGSETQEGDLIRAAGGTLEIQGAKKRARLASGRVEDVDSWKGPWAGYVGEEETRKSALQMGTLSEDQKKIRVAQGYKPDKPGKVKDEAGTAPTIPGGPDLSSLPPAAAAGAGEVTEAVEPPVAEQAAVSKTQKKKHGKSTINEVPAHEFDWGEEVVPANTGDTISAADAKSNFHGKSEYDYQGRSWIEPPKGLHPDGGDHECFLPKKCIHKFTGHTKGVQSIQFFPNTGHLLLSGSMDSKVKIWDVMADRNVRRTYSGHTAAVREVKFNNDGLKFSSVSYDRHVKFWDTESGKCTMDITNGKVPYCCTWYPEDNNIVLIGTANRKIMQYDIRTGEMVLEYDSHLGAVNTITFFDENRRIATTSDDKKVIIWDFNAPVPIKTIADPSMHAITAATLHPDGATIACQSMDNQVAVYYSGEKTGLNRRKRFTGHVVAGYACQVGFSPNGQYVISGDGEGNVWFWDWKTTKVLKKLKCHDHGPAISVGWHPVNPSWVATCGWDGLIKLWD